MNFPITRERLQNYLQDEVFLVERKERLERVIQKICKNVELTLLKTTNKFYVFNITADIFGSMRYQIENKMPQPTSILDEVMDRLKELFIDCKIQVDTLNGYILIDWS